MARARYELIGTSSRRTKCVLPSSAVMRSASARASASCAYGNDFTPTPDGLQTHQTIVTRPELRAVDFARLLPPLALPPLALPPLALPAALARSVDFAASDFSFAAAAASAAFCAMRSRFDILPAIASAPWIAPEAAAVCKVAGCQPCRPRRIPDPPRSGAAAAAE